MKFRVYISDVSAFVGRHPYKDRDEAFRRVLSYNPELFEEVEMVLRNDVLLYRPLYEKLAVTWDNVSSPTAEEKKDPSINWEHRVQEACADRPEIQAMVEDLKANAKPATEEDLEKQRNARPSRARVEKEILATMGKDEVILDTNKKIKLEVKDTQEATTRCETIMQEFASSRNVAIPEDMMSSLRNSWQASRGTYLEDTTVSRIYKEFELQPGESLKAQMGCGTVFRVGEHDVLLLGKVDAAVVDARGFPVECIEIKNRRSRFWRPEYDVDQLSMYISALATEKGGWLVQQMNGEIQRWHMSLDDARERVHGIIEPDLQEAVRSFVRAVENPTDPDHWKLWEKLVVVASERET